MGLNDQYVAKLTPGTKSTISNQYFDLNRPFAPPRYGNECTAYICGRDYMKAVADAIRSAKRFIFIADWQLDYDVELDQRGVPGHPGRLSELLADALHRGIHIRIICYDSVDTLTHGLALVGKSGPPDTHEENSQSALNNLPKGKGSIKVMLQNPNTTNSDIFLKKKANVVFSHHQKLVVIDGRMAFLGGIDLAYGRWDTPSFNIIIDPLIHVINDAYNSQIISSRTPLTSEQNLTQGRAGRPGFHAPLYTSGGKLLDPKTQPRMPWNDVGLMVDGPAVYDVFVNFVLRWNSFARSKGNLLDSMLDAPWFERIIKGHETLVDPLKQGTGTANIQICRSASSAQLQDELILWDPRKKYIHDDWKKPDLTRRHAIYEARREWVTHHQTSIHDAMVQSIRSAQAFIYIENQFFVTACGKDKNGTIAPAKNNIVTELADAISRAVYTGRPFHVWLVLPEQPEGPINSEAVKAQAWWALQGVKHGTESLINKINTTILLKNKQTWGLRDIPQTNTGVLEVLKNHNLEDGWRDYLTVLNLRNYGASDSHVLTEMIYVHSKVLIVDDAVAIIGSANINDRSLLGNGDTELAAVIVDTAEAGMTDVGQGVRCITRRFARNLRTQLWNKILGTLIDQPTSGVQREDAPPLNIDLRKPLSKESINGIYSLARSNRTAYNSVFSHTHRNEFPDLESGLQLYPRLTRKTKDYNPGGITVGEFGPSGTRRDPFVFSEKETQEPDLSKAPPLQRRYMSNNSHAITSAITELRKQIKGFIVEMPLEWGSKEKETPAPPQNNPLIIATMDNKSTET